MTSYWQYQSIQSRAQEQFSLFDEDKAVSVDKRNDSVQVQIENENHEHEWPFATIEGIRVQKAKDGTSFYQVDWESASDPLKPRNWPLWQRFGTMVLLDVVAAVTTAASSIDSAVVPQAADDFGVSELVETLGGTGIFLIGFGLGAFVAAPASEMLGRLPVYLMALTITACWILGAALAPDIGSQIIFRFLAGFFASAPLTVAGGSMNDLWSTREMTWAFPMFAVIGFAAPVVSVVVASFIGQTGVLSWRWTEWLMLICIGLIILLLLAGMRETYSPRLLKLKAAKFREMTGNEKFLTSVESEAVSLHLILRKNMTRPWILAMEPIVFLFTLYNTIVYIVLFTFLVSYTYIFEKLYGISQGLKNVCFLGLAIGVVLLVTVIPLATHVTNKQLRQPGDDGSGRKLKQELRLIFAMIGAPAIPVGLFWMAWTASPTISIWSPLTASIPIGFGMVCVFVSSYMYVIDSYQIYAASALTFVTCIRYVAAGVMTVVAVPMYERLGVQWSLSLLGFISALVAPVPYALYIWGPKIRKKSRYAVF